MTKTSNSKQTKQYNLEERTFQFAKKARDYVNRLPKTISNIEYGKQLIRASGSQAANYIEANEALSKKDFAMHIKICRKEVKESNLWIRLTEPKPEDEPEKHWLLEESLELRKIFSAILENAK